jgi:hypothetical protein
MMRDKLVLLLVVMSLLAACDNAASSLIRGTQTLSGAIMYVRGDLNRIIATNFDSVQYIDTTVATADGFLLYLRKDGDYWVYFQLPKNPQPGTYHITPNVFNGLNVTARYVENGNGKLSTFTAQSGMLTLDVVGNTYSGTFEFTARGGTEGITPDQEQQITITGTFMDIPRLGNPRA